MIKKTFLVALGAFGIWANYQFGIKHIPGGYFTGIPFAILLLLIANNFSTVPTKLLSEDEKQNPELNDALVFAFVYAGVMAAIYHLGVINR